MPTSRMTDSHATKDLELPLRVPYFGKEADNLRDPMPELPAYLKSRYPNVREVRLSFSESEARRSATIFAKRTLWLDYHRCFNPFTQKVIGNLADHVYKWLKKRLPVKKQRHKQRGFEFPPDYRAGIVHPPMPEVQNQTPSATL